MATVYNRGKPFSWSYSELKNYAACPRKHFEVDIAKNLKEPESDILKWGNQVHDAFHKRLGKKIPFATGMEQFEEWALKMERIPGTLMVEQQLAIDDSFQPCEWFGKNAWHRGIADVLVINGPVAYAGDWKLGKILEDSVQLALVSACVFAHHPQVQAIRTEFIWLKDDAQTREDFRRTDLPKIWANVIPRVMEYKNAVDTSAFNPKPSGLCKRHCIVSTCPYFGKGG